MRRHTLGRRPLALLGETVRDHVQLNEIVFSVAISVCEKAGRWQQALHLLEDVRTKHLRADCLLYGGVIAACGRAGKWQQGLCLLQEAEQMLLQTNLITYSTAISACEQAGEWQQAVHLLHSIATKRMKLDTICLNTVISAFARVGEWLAAMTLLTMMKHSKTMRPDDITYACAVRACETASAWGMALVLLQDSELRKVPPNIVAINSAIAACGQSTEWVQALWLCRKSRERRVRLNVASCTSAIRACQDAAVWQQALQVLSSMRSLGVRANLDSYYCSLQACLQSSEWKQAQGILKAMEAKQVWGTLYTLSPCQLDSMEQKLILIDSRQRGAPRARKHCASSQRRQPRCCEHLQRQEAELMPSCFARWSVCCQTCRPPVSWLARFPDHALLVESRIDATFGSAAGSSCATCTTRNAIEMLWLPSMNHLNLAEACSLLGKAGILRKSSKMAHPTSSLRTKRIYMTDFAACATARRNGLLIGFPEQAGPFASFPKPSASLSPRNPHITCCLQLYHGQAYPSLLYLIIHPNIETK